MDKISKRSKGYAFIEYTTEEAAGTALKEMNGKVVPQACLSFVKQNFEFSSFDIVKEKLSLFPLLADHKWVDDNCRCCQKKSTKIFQRTT